MEETSQRKNWLVWGVVGVLLVSVVVGGMWVYLRGRERAQRAGPLQTGEEVTVYPTVAVAQDELETQFEPVDWTVIAVGEGKIELEGIPVGQQQITRWTIEMDRVEELDLQAGQKVKVEFSSQGELRIIPI